MIRYKVNIWEELKKNGYTSGVIQREKLLPGQTRTNLMTGKSISIDTLNKICCMLRCQPGDLLDFTMTDEEKIKYFK